MLINEFVINDVTICLKLRLKASIMYHIIIIIIYIN